MDYVALAVFLALFALVTVIGFMAARWKRGDLDLLHEWGLGGRRFGTWITWFLLGGDIYTAYTFIAVPAALYAGGAGGFFAVPYTVLIYPILYAIFPKLWTISKRNGYITAADYVRGHFGNRWTALAVALTGLVATMPYIALQLVGMEVVIGALGFDTTGVAGDVPLLIAFAVLALFTYSSGLRAPAMIAVVKDTLIYITVIAAVIVIPYKLGGYGALFDAVPPAKLLLAPPTETSTGAFSTYATLALGSAIALFMYPHAFTAILSSSSARVIRRNAALLPAYSLVLGLLALLGFMAIAAGLGSLPEFAAGFKAYPNNYAIPALFQKFFPSWFVGVAFAAIAIGALVPAAIMSIATANTFTRNIYKEFFNPRCTDAEEARVAKITSLLVKAGALIFVFTLDKSVALEFQLLGGIWMSQVFPAVVLSLYTRMLNGWGVLLGWGVGTAFGTYLAWMQGFKAVFPFAAFGVTFPCFIALAALALNVAVAVAASAVINALAPRSRAAPTYA